MLTYLNAGSVTGDFLPKAPCSSINDRPITVSIIFAIDISYIRGPSSSTVIMFIYSNAESAVGNFL